MAMHPSTDARHEKIKKTVSKTLLCEEFEDASLRFRFIAPFALALQAHLATIHGDHCWRIVLRHVGAIWVDVELVRIAWGLHAEDSFRHHRPVSDLAPKLLRIRQQKRLSLHGQILVGNCEHGLEHFKFGRVPGEVSDARSLDSWH